MLGPMSTLPLLEISLNQEITLSSPDGERKTVIDENGVLWGNLKTEPIEGFEWRERPSSMLAEPMRAFSVKMCLLGLGASSFSPCIPSLAVLETWHMLNTAVPLSYIFGPSTCLKSGSI